MTYIYSTNTVLTRLMTLSLPLFQVSFDTMYDHVCMLNDLLLVFVVN